MKKMLLISVVAVFAIGCATTSTGTATSTVPDAPAVAVQASVPIAPVATPIVAAASPRVQVEATTGFVPVNAMMTDSDRTVRATEVKGRAPQRGQASTILTPATTAFGGVDNNPVEGPGYDISQVKDYGKRDGTADHKRNDRSNSKIVENFTKASWVEGNNPAEDGATVSHSQVTQEEKDGRSGSAGRPSGKLNDRFSPLTKIADNNPMDEGSNALEVPRSDTTGAQERFENRAAGRMLMPAATPSQIDMTAKPALRDMNSNHMRDTMLERRSLASDNNPFNN